MLRFRAIKKEALQHPRKYVRPQGEDSMLRGHSLTRGDLLEALDRGLISVRAIARITGLGRSVVQKFIDRSAHPRDCLELPPRARAALVRYIGEPEGEAKPSGARFYRLKTSA